MESASKVREQQVESATAQVEALRADLEKAEGQLAEAQAQLLTLRKARLDEAQTAAAELRAFKVVGLSGSCLFAHHIHPHAKTANV